MRAGRDRDPAARGVEGRDEHAVDVDLRIAHVAADREDRILARDARRDRLAAARYEQHEKRRSHGDPDIDTSITSPTTFTFTEVSLAGGLRAICAMRSSDSVVVTPITQPPGDNRRITAFCTPFAPTRYFCSASTMPHGVFGD